jgi:hypothetical protein
MFGCEDWMTKQRLDDNAGREVASVDEASDALQ